MADSHGRYAGDLSDPDAVDALDAEVDVLVNNAGLQFVAALPDFPPDRFAHLQKVVLERAAIKRLIEPADVAELVAQSLK